MQGLTHKDDVYGRFINIDTILEVQTYNDHNIGIIRYGGLRYTYPNYTKYTIPIDIAKKIIEYGRLLNHQQ